MRKGASSRKKYTYIWVSAVVLVFGIFAVLEITKRIEEGSVVDNNRLAGASSVEELTYIVYDGKKRKVPSFAFLNQDSVLVTDRDYLGKVYVIDFFFTTCPTICPVMTANLVNIQNTFKEHADFGAASFTINPRYDTPSVLKQYANKSGITDRDWHLLTGSQDSIYSLAKEGFYIMAKEADDAPGGFEHSGMFALVDRQGFIRSRMDRYGNPIIYYRGTISEEQGVNTEGESQQITMLKEDIQKLLLE